MYFCFITFDYYINVFIYFKNKITSILELKMIKYYLFAIYLYSKLRVLNSVLYALADQNMFTVTCSMNSIERDIEYWNKFESMKKLVTMYQQCTDTFELWNRQILFDTSRICILKTPLLIVRYNNYDIELIRTSEKYVVYYFSPLQSLVSNIVIQASYLKRCTCFIHCIEKIVVLFYIEALPSWLNYTFG